MNVKEFADMLVQCSSNLPVVGPNNGPVTLQLIEAGTAVQVIPMDGKAVAVATYDHGVSDEEE